MAHVPANTETDAKNHSEYRKDKQSFMRNRYPAGIPTTPAPKGPEKK